MADKKNEDYAVRMPEGSDAFEGEKDPFIAQTPPQQAQRPFGSSFLGGSGVSLSKLDNSPGVSIIAYCLSSISMTMVNKYVVSGTDWNMNFLYLAIQVRGRTRTSPLRPF